MPLFIPLRDYKTYTIDSEKSSFDKNFILHILIPEDDYIFKIYDLSKSDSAGRKHQNALFIWMKTTSGNDQDLSSNDTNLKEFVFEYSDIDSTMAMPFPHAQFDSNHENTLLIIYHDDLIGGNEDEIIEVADFFYSEIHERVAEATSNLGFFQEKYPPIGFMPKKAGVSILRKSI